MADHHAQLASNAIAGIDIIDLTTHSDPRGQFTELYRQEWNSDAPIPVQWNYVCSRAGVLRGVHGHIRHADHLVVLDGEATIGLKDVRHGSPTEGATHICNLSGNNLQALIIPPGVAHGFYFHTRTAHVYAVSSYWDHSDELGCRWDDPELALDWPFSTAEISDRDARLPTFSEFRRRMNALQPFHPLPIPD